MWKNMKNSKTIPPVNNKVLEMDGHDLFDSAEPSCPDDAGATSHQRQYASMDDTINVPNTTTPHDEP